MSLPMKTGSEVPGSSCPEEAEVERVRDPLESSADHTVNAEEHGGDGAATARGDSEEDFHGETFTVSEEVMNNLLMMGFSENAIKKSIVAGCIDEGTSTQWIGLHQGHPELDTPLADDVRVVVKVRRVLTDAEREAKVQELKLKAKVKRETEAEKARREQLTSEKKRIENQKRLLETKHIIDKARKESELAELKREREADTVARQKIRFQLLVDKYVRQGSTAEEARQRATSEMEEAALKRMEEAAEVLKHVRVAKDDVSAAPAAATGVSSTWNLEALIGSSSGDRSTSSDFVAQFSGGSVPSPTEEAFCNVVRDMKAAHGEEAAALTIGVLRTILSNITLKPMETKTRMFRTNTSTFLTKIGTVPEAITLLRMCNFELVVDSNGNSLATMNVMVTRHLRRALRALGSASQ